MGKKIILVTGAGGFIGHHLVKRLSADGHSVRGVDVKFPEFEASAAQEFFKLDLRYYENCIEATSGVDEVYHLAADMGGIGYITASHAGITLNNTLINAHMTKAAVNNTVKRFLFSSSACIYPQYLQNDPDVTPLRGRQRIPGRPRRGLWPREALHGKAMSIRP